MATRIMPLSHVYGELAKATGKWVLYARDTSDDCDEDVSFSESAKALGTVIDYNPRDGKETDQALYEGALVALCDTKTECDALFNQIVGDDGPTPDNAYNGPARWYACTYGPSGMGFNENT